MFERCVPFPKEPKLGPVIDIREFLDSPSHLLP